MVSKSIDETPQSRTITRVESPAAILQFDLCWNQSEQRAVNSLVSQVSDTREEFQDLTQWIALS